MNRLTTHIRTQIAFFDPRRPHAAPCAIPPRLNFYAQPMRWDGEEHVIVTETYKTSCQGFPGDLVSGKGCAGLWRPVRSHLLSETSDLDMKVAMPTILLWICKQFGIACPHLEWYVNHREDALAKLMRLWWQRWLWWRWLRRWRLRAAAGVLGRCAAWSRWRASARVCLVGGELGHAHMRSRAHNNELTRSNETHEAHVPHTRMHTCSHARMCQPSRRCSGRLMPMNPGRRFSLGTAAGRAWVAHVAHEPQSGPLGRRTATYRIDIAARRPTLEKPAS